MSKFERIDDPKINKAASEFASTISAHPLYSTKVSKKVSREFVQSVIDELTLFVEVLTEEIDE